MVVIASAEANHLGGSLSSRNNSARAGDPRPSDELVGPLVELGLSRTEARVYLALLGAELSTAAEVAAAAGVPRPKVYEALSSLESRGLCVPVADRSATRYRAVPGEESIRQLVRRRDQERRVVAEQDEHAAETLLRELPARDGGRRGASLPLEHIEAVHGRSATGSTYERLIGEARERVTIMTRPPYLQARARWGEAERAALRRGVALRVIHPSDDALGSERYDDLVAEGAEVGLLDELPMKVITRDSAEALVTLRDPVTREELLTSMLIRHPDLVRPLELLFAREWRRARPLRLLDVRGAEL